MNSSNFYNNIDFKYPEIAISLEDSENIGKFFIPVLTPFLSSDEAYDKKEMDSPKTNITNRDQFIHDIEPCILSNYITLSLPKNDVQCKKGDKFVISFIGGDINKPYIIGRYN